jgi:hypothetical protein
MPARKPRPADERPQIEDFIETAHKLGSDESREGFERVFEKITAYTPASLGSSPPGSKASTAKRIKESVSKK